MAPGLDEQDIEALLNDGVLTLKGEKRSEVEDQDRQFSERFYGRFERHIRLALRSGKMRSMRISGTAC
ncbi:Hsp20/alpha crystallin family protein [Paracoccus sp. SSJ]|nr:MULTISPECIES: Hsp20/alpha crystallin family protein [Paracoccus]MDK8875575.1 Hsp20/alpha crystallin family protein [Paracoccus sp. SSJ]